MIKSIEKRRFLRIPALARIQFRKIGDTIFHRRLSRDISIAGIRFLSAQFVPNHSNIKINLQLKEEERPIEFVCRVAWIRSLYNDEYFEIGAEIRDISREGHEKLKNFIAATLSAGR